jgi:hypothetical protein
VSKKRTIEIIVYIIFLFPIYIWWLCSETYDFLKYGGPHDYTLEQTFEEGI